MAFRQLRGLDTPPAGASRGDTGSSTTSQGSSSGFADSSLSPPSTTSLAPKIQPSTVASTSGRSSGSSQSSRDSAARSMSAQASSSIATSGRTRDVVIALMPPESSVGELDVEQDDSSPSLHATLTTRHAFPGSEQRSRGSSRWARRPLPQTRHVSQRTFHAAIAAEPCTSSSLIDSEDQDPPMHFATGPSGQIPVYPTRPPEFTYKSAGADKIS
ncbi:hypothetical protein B0A48_17845 [Cryoendolithus antarcticus]|uniref:Uncharacterized protein n=1 Tax=Cryoendolithus antarcticus TaxID=1507870 RepID=A0A1V8SA65_9PEZI|nr:hypothetical protein B0A48_17845 [Cryoendolithus antarcticus]